MVLSKNERGPTFSMRIAICDDNTAFVDTIVREITRWSAVLDLESDYLRFSSSKALLEHDLSSVQVLFLDIEMPKYNGIEVAHKIRENHPDIILVFVTSWLQYAPAGYRVNAFRYLLKNRLADELPQCLNEIRQKICETDKSIILQQRERSQEILIKDILYCEGTPHRSVLVHCLSMPDKALECTGKLRDYENRLAAHGFLRIQKSYLVNMAHIDRIKNHMAVLRNGNTLKVSEKNYSNVCKQFLMWRGTKL